MKLSKVFSGTLLIVWGLFASAYSEEIKLGEGFSVLPENLTVTYRGSILATGPMSREVNGLERQKDTVRWSWEAARLTVEVSSKNEGVLDVRFIGESDARTEWPSLTIGKDETLAWARHSGLLLSPRDNFWRDLLVESEWNTLDKMSMPVWGVLSEQRCVSWMVSTPFRNSLKFSEGGPSAALSLDVSHHFHPKSEARDVTFRIVIDEAYSPVTPGIRYREWLDETSPVTTLLKKQEEIPKVERLLGAPHVYLWDSGIVTVMDVKPRSWKSLCTSILSRSEVQGSPSAKLKQVFSEEQWELLTEASTIDYPYQYMKHRIAEGLSSALRSDAFMSDDEDEKVRIVENAKFLVDEFPGVFLPIEKWGNGASIKMLTALEGLGFERLRLCLPGWELVEHRPWVAEQADAKGWLFGTYDSYHSIHDPKHLGTDGTWITAQMTQELWEGGGVMKEDGSYRKGFKGKGKKLNPFAARSFFVERVSTNLKTIPFNSYFIDCDAYGEVYDDYHPAHSNSMEAGASERTRRLGWLAEEKGLVVGSEGGNVYAIEGVHFLEGVFGPFFGWSDPDMKDRESKFYRGRYFPPDQPKVNFKPIPLKEQFEMELYDPSVRIPLFQAAFHDAVVTTHHWSNDRFKYPSVKETVGLQEILWMCPPLVHLNLKTIKERGPDLKHHYERWSPLHQELGFAKLVDFRYLSEDRLVQETVWEEGQRIIVNFGGSDWTVDDGSLISAGDFVYRATEGP